MLSENSNSTSLFATLWEVCRLGPEELQYWHPLERTWVIDAATFDVLVGGDVTASLGATFEITAV